MKCNQLVTVTLTGLLVATGAMARSEDLATRLTDEQITQHVKEKLSADEPGVAPRIIVSTRDGVVTLMANNLTTSEMVTAMDDARGTGGVVRVENRMQLG